MRAERGNDVIIVLVGNKTDLNDKREVTTQQGEDEAKKNNLMFVETSAKSGHNVEVVFERATRDILEKVRKGEFDEDRVRADPFAPPRFPALNDLSPDSPPA